MLLNRQAGVDLNPVISVSTAGFSTESESVYCNMQSSEYGYIAYCNR